MVNKRAIVVALIFSLFIALVLWNKLQQQQQIVPTPIAPIIAEPPKIPTLPVVVAKTKILSRTKLDRQAVDQLFDIKEIVASSVPPSAYSSIASITNKYTSVTILAGDIMTPERILEGDAIPALSFAIPKGKRAVTIAVSKERGVAGFIQQGDIVDVIATFRPSTFNKDTVTKIVLQDILILAVGNSYEFDMAIASPTPSLPAGKAEFVTLAVSPEELERLVYLDSGVTFRLVLKNPNEKGDKVKTPGVIEKDVIKAFDLGNGEQKPEESPSVVSAPQPAPPPAIVEPIEEKVEVFYGSRRVEMTKSGENETVFQRKPDPLKNAKVPENEPESE
ncbi:Flp pilus assembly protein CpaB [bacterium]|nr:Flp pilus assembly protein CpaB [bacterium]